jgi:S1-C subfamily serine protease
MLPKWQERLWPTHCNSLNLPGLERVNPGKRVAIATRFMETLLRKYLWILGEHKYELRRATLESVLGNVPLLLGSVRIVPELRAGKATGFRLFAVHPEGPFALIGMQNGDIISSVNGLEITSPEQGLAAYTKLKSANHLSLGMERNGQKVTKEYRIH